MSASASPWFTLLLCDVNKEMVAAWRHEFEASGAVPVKYHEGRFEEVRTPFECIVSPANSFGLMDGGIDLYISKYFGGVETFVPRVQRALLEEFCGQQPVGSSFIIRTGKTDGCKFLAHTPTMRMPARVAGTDIAYRATWSMLVAVRNHNRRITIPEDRISTVLCAGFGTGVGGMSVSEAARQMSLAHKHFVRNPADTPADATSAPTAGRPAPWDASFLMTWRHALAIDSEVKETVFQHEP